MTASTDTSSRTIEAAQARADNQNHHWHRHQAWEIDNHVDPSTGQNTYQDAIHAIDHGVSGGLIYRDIAHVDHENLEAAAQSDRHHAG